mmetsp:Transcript_15941/g.28589  ORF Transcript_15941/g.28589 Transcript_15941/m.28589 type:complete len:429 (+) Transcript_15941:157-1443(+)|eukprot:CAMPEP_0197539958 /NCGR_PEP_ID=MMETSP1318-20131121/64299_1 /TAXON_ID=552666 /ORGANISM="Partenskyella glossopodia, Strain RCC365" /LENGTH=428 /DNA_ID=CAMNT_0043098815 /DNA_START=128 /DNA_END=1414 /DNA_ORIENTATION=+
MNAGVLEDRSNAAGAGASEAAVVAGVSKLHVGVETSRGSKGPGWNNAATCYEIAVAMRKKQISAEAAGRIMRRILPPSLYEALPGKAAMFFIPTSPVFPKLAYISLRKCKERLDSRAGYILGANVPQLLELDASRCEIYADFLASILGFCRKLKTLTVQDSVIIGESVVIESKSVELLTFNSKILSPLQLGRDSKSTRAPVPPLRLRCPNLRQIFLNFYPLLSSSSSSKPLSSSSNASSSSLADTAKNRRIDPNAGTSPQQIASKLTDLKSLPLNVFKDLQSDLLLMTKLEHLVLTAVVLKNSFFRKISRVCPNLRILCIDDALGVSEVCIEHDNLTELSLVDCGVQDLILGCSSLQHLAITRCNVQTCDLHIPELKSLEYRINTDASRTIVSKIVKNSFNLVELNGLPFNESHPDVPNLEADWCPIS